MEIENKKVVGVSESAGLGKNSRQHIRTKLRAEVKLSHAILGEIQLHTGDISDGGAYVFADGNALPAIGEQVEVQVQGMGGGDAPILNMRVVRVDKEGIGLEFIRDDGSA